MHAAQKVEPHVDRRGGRRGLGLGTTEALRRCKGQIGCLVRTAADLHQHPGNAEAQTGAGRRGGRARGLGGWGNTQEACDLAALSTTVRTGGGAEPAGGG